MDEYIKRKAVINLITRRYENPEICTQEINSIPAADVAPVVHGRWLCVDTDTEQFFLCNRCKKKEYWESNYCPNCGCLMDGGEQDA